MILFRTLKELSTKRLTADQKNFAEVHAARLFCSHLPFCLTMQTVYTSRLSLQLYVHPICLASPTFIG